MIITVYKIISFVSSENGGNEAGVVLNADKLTEEQMKRLANKAGFSETAFIINEYKDEYKVRFFTPNKEVELCGHATVAVFSVLKNLKLINSGKYSLDTKAGLVKVSIDNQNNVFLKQPYYKFYEKMDYNSIENCFNISEKSLIKDLPIQIVSTGLKDIILPIKNLDILFSMKPDFDTIIQISKLYHVVGIHAFTLETKYNSTAHCRNFAPLYDIPEEAATGTSNGALACYLHKYNKLKDTDEILTFEQGYSMNKPSLILAKINKGKYIYIGGKAIVANTFQVEI